MSKGDWHFIVAMAGFLLLAGLLWFVLRPPQPRVASAADIRPGYAQQVAGDPRCNPLRLQRLPADQAWVDRYSCNRQRSEDRLRSEEIVQQTRSTDATVAMVDLNYRQLIVLVGGAIVGLLTLVAAFFAAWYAKRAAEAANAQVDTARDTARRQLRAYLSVQKGRVEEFKVGSKPFFCVDLRNNGQTPAYHCRRRDDMLMTAENPDTLRIRFDGISASLDIGPSHERNAYYKMDYSLTAKEMGLFKEGKLTPVFAGVISYLDAFGQTRRNVFRLCLKPHMLDTKGCGRLTLCARNNSSN